MQKLVKVHIGKEAQAAIQEYFTTKLKDSFRPQHTAVNINTQQREIMEITVMVWASIYFQLNNLETEAQALITPVDKVVNLTMEFSEELLQLAYTLNKEFNFKEGEKTPLDLPDRVVITKDNYENVFPLLLAISPGVLDSGGPRHSDEPYNANNMFLGLADNYQFSRLIPEPGQRQA